MSSSSLVVSGRRGAARRAGCGGRRLAAHVGQRDQFLPPLGSVDSGCHVRPRFPQRVTRERMSG